MALSGNALFVISGAVNILTNAAQKELTELEKQAAKTGKEIGLIEKAWNFAAPGILGVMSGLLIKLAKDAFQFGVDVDSAMKKYQVAVGASAAETEKFGQAIGNLRQVNDESTEEIAAALTAVRRQFGDLGADTERVTQQFLDFADATGGNAAESAKEIGQTLRAWGLEAKDTGQLMDVLTKASQESGISAEQLSGTLGQSSALFQSMGFSVEQATSVLAGLGKQGVDSGAVLTGLRNTLEAAQAPTEKQSAAFKTLGLAVDDMGRPVGGAKGLFEDLQDRIASGSLNADQMTAALDILGKKSGGDLVRGMVAAGDSVDDLQQKLLNADGATAAAADAEGAQLGKRVEKIYRDYFEPAVQFLGKAFTEGAGKTLDFVENALGTIRQFADAAGNVWVNMGQAFSQVGQGIEDVWNDIIAGLQRTLADWLTQFVGALDSLPNVVKSRLGDVRGSVAATAQGLKEDADKRTSGREGRETGFSAIGAGLSKAVLSDSLGGESQVDVQDVLVDRKDRGKKGPLTGKAAPGEEGAGKSDGDLRLERDIKLLERKIQLEQISKSDAIAALDVLIQRSKDQGASEEDIFKLQKERLSLVKAIAAEQEKADKAVDSAAKKAAAEAERDAKKAASEREASAKKAAAEAEKAAKEAATAEETRRKGQLAAEIDLAKMRGQTHREALLQIQEQVRDMRAAGVDEQTIAETVAAKKKALLADEEKTTTDTLSRIEKLRKGESLLGQGGDTFGGVMSLEEAFKTKDPGKSDTSGPVGKKDLAKGDLSAGALGAALDGLAGGGLGAAGVSSGIGGIKNIIAPSVDPSSLGGNTTGQAAANAAASSVVRLDITVHGSDEPGETQSANVGGIGVNPNKDLEFRAKMSTTPLRRI